LTFFSKYPLLFTELLKSTPKTHPDYPVIEATIEKVRHVTDSVNKSTAFQENITKLFELKELLVGFPEVILPHLFVSFSDV
jgi:cell division control protein 24